MKRGSHAVVPLTDKLNLPIVMPHGEKFVHPLDLKRLQYVLNGEIEKAGNNGISIYTKPLDTTEKLGSMTNNAFSRYIRPALEAHAKENK